jgi:hypothetical protein
VDIIAIIAVVAAAGVVWTRHVLVAVDRMSTSADAENFLVCVVCPLLAMGRQSPRGRGRRGRHWSSKHTIVLVLLLQRGHHIVVQRQERCRIAAALIQVIITVVRAVLIVTARQTTPNTVRSGDARIATRRASTMLLIQMVQLKVSLRSHGGRLESARRRRARIGTTVAGVWLHAPRASKPCRPRISRVRVVLSDASSAALLRSVGLCERSQRFVAISFIIIQLITVRSTIIHCPVIVRQPLRCDRRSLGR